MFYMALPVVGRSTVDRPAESQTMAKRKTSTILNYFEPQAKKSRLKNVTQSLAQSLKIVLILYRL